MLSDEKQIDQVSPASRGAAFVCARVGVQLLGDLPFHWDEQHLDGFEPEFRQDSGPDRRRPLIS